MRRFSRSLVVIGLAAGLALPAMVMAAPQGDVSVHHDHGTVASSQTAARADVRPDMMARMKALDERIKTLTADMNMFVGDMKVQTMASLLTAMVERQSLMRDEMATMRDGMKMGAMMNMDKGPTMYTNEDAPGFMCAPEPAAGR